MSEDIIRKSESNPNNKSLEHPADTRKLKVYGLVGCLILFTLVCGCTGTPFFSGAKPVEESNVPDTRYPSGDLSPGGSPDGYPIPDGTLPGNLPLDVTPEPTPTPPVSNISDWDPYAILPYPDPPLNHTSINRNDTFPGRKNLNTTYTGSFGLAGHAIGKDLNIINGPFSITYTVYPNISSPLDVWVKLTVFDPWQNVIAEGGYNRGYPCQETQTMTIYREGRYFLTIDGAFASVDYVIKTSDPLPAVTQTPVSAEETQWMDEEEMR